MNKILYKTDQNHPQIKEYKEAVKVLSDEKVVSAFGGTKLT